MKKQFSAGSISVPFRRFLYGTAATTGAVILIVEILGAKMLSPFLGTSHFVWTAQIAVTLVALAAGYWLGGWMADRDPSLDRLYWCIAWAGVFLAITVAAVEPLAYFFVARARLAVGALFTSAFLFFIPLTLLAAVGPFCIRALTQNVSGVGGQVGRLTAVSTLGSVMGTLLIGYVLIPFLPNSYTMYASAALLLLLAGAYFLWNRRLKVVPAVLVLGLFSLGIFGLRAKPATPSSWYEELYRGNSNFGLLQVIQNAGGTRRYYLNDFLTQNTYDPQSGESLSMFTYMLHHLARSYVPEVRNVLCIGLGIGIVPMKFAREGVQVDVVEINPDVIPVAARFFKLEPEKLKIQVGDGRYFVNQTTNRYDAIVLDAFLGDSSPSHLMSREAFEQMRRVLRPGGVLVINSFGDFAPGHEFFTASLHRTLSAVFAEVRIHTSGNGNVFFVAADRKPLDFVRTPVWEEIPAGPREEVRAAFNDFIPPPSGGQVLTDDHNPVEYFDAANRERLRRQLAVSMRPQR